MIERTKETYGYFKARIDDILSSDSSVEEKKEDLKFLVEIFNAESKLVSLRINTCYLSTRSNRGDSPRDLVKRQNMLVRLLEETKSAFGSLI